MDWVNLVYVGMVLLSGVFSLMIPLGYFLGKARQHPGQVMVAICLLETITSYNLLLVSLNIFDFEKAVHLETFLSFLTAGQVELDTQNGLLFCRVNLYFYFLLETLNIFYNSVICLDLLLTLYWPFLSGKARNKYYHCACLLLTALSFLLLNFETQTICKEQNDASQGLLLIPQDFIKLQLVFIGAGILSIGHGVYYCLRNDKGNGGKREYIVKHILTVLALLVVWMIPVVNVEFIDVGQQQVYRLINNISFSLLLSSSFILNMVRLTDPYFRHAILQLLLFRTRPESSLAATELDGQQASDDAWLTSLAELAQQQQNQQLLVHILTSIKASLKLSRDQSWSNLPSIEQIMDFEQGRLRVHLTSYAPAQFAAVRDRELISEEGLQLSFDLAQNKKKIKESKESLGASGKFFFFTYDNKYVVKTAEKQEIDILLSLLPNIPAKGSTLINQYYGAFTIAINSSTQIHCLLLQNTLESLLDRVQLQHLRLYDLKGSLINRESGPKSTALKDMDFLKSQALFIRLHRQQFEQLYIKLQKDSAFLCAQNIMDYSMMLAAGQHQGQLIYGFSLIDCLQKFDFWKKVEYYTKTLLLGKKEELLSCVQPFAYRTRLLAFFRASVLIIK